MSQQLRQHLANFLGSYPSSPYVVASLLVVLLLSLSAMGFFSLSSHFKPAGKVSSTSSVQGRSNAVELALLHRRGDPKAWVSPSRLSSQRPVDRKSVV